VRTIALRGLWGRKLRTILTGFAIVLGIATISGTFVLTDSITHAFNTIFSSIYVGTDASITGKSAVSADATTDLPPFDESLLAKVKALPDVQAAVGGVGDVANLIGENGKVISFGGAPHLGFSVDPSQPKFNSLTLVEGGWPGNGEVVITELAAAVPEPASIALLGVGLIGLAAISRRRRPERRNSDTCGAPRGPAL